MSSLPTTVQVNQQSSIRAVQVPPPAPPPEPQPEPPAPPPEPGRSRGRCRRRNRSRSPYRGPSRTRNRCRRRLRVTLRCPAAHLARVLRRRADRGRPAFCPGGHRHPGVTAGARRASASILGMEGFPPRDVAGGSGGGRSPSLSAWAVAWPRVLRDIPGRWPVTGRCVTGRQARQWRARAGRVSPAGGAPGSVVSCWQGGRGRGCGLAGYRLPLGRVRILLRSGNGGDSADAAGLQDPLGDIRPCRGLTLAPDRPARGTGKCGEQLGWAKETNDG